MADLPVYNLLFAGTSCKDTAGHGGNICKTRAYEDPSPHLFHPLKKIYMSDDPSTQKGYLISHKPSELLPDSMEDVFHSLFASLKSCSGIGKERLVCTDAISIWLLRSAHMQDPPSIDGESVKFLFHYVVDFWNESGAPLGNSLRELSLKLLSYLRTRNDRQSLVDYMIRVTVNLPHTSRVTYFLMEHLSKETDSPKKILQEKPEFLPSTLSVMNYNTLANPAGKCIQTLLKQVYSEDDESGWLSLWDGHVINALQEKSLWRNLQIYLLPYLFQTSPVAFKMFIKQLDDTAALLGCLRIGQDLAIVEEPFHGDDSLISIDTVERLLYHENGQFRVQALALLVSSPRRSKPVRPYVFDIVQRNLLVMLDETDLRTRNDFQSLMRQFITRVRDSAYSMERDNSKLRRKGIPVEDDGVLRIKDFCHWLLGVINDRIAPSCPYQHVNFAYKLLVILCKSGLDSSVDKRHYEKQHLDYPFRMEIFNETSRRLLVDNMTHDFEDVRSSSRKLLLMSSIPPSDNLTGKALSMLGESKEKFADGGSQILVYYYTMFPDQRALIVESILQRLHEAITFAQADLSKAMYTHNVFGYFMALRLIAECNPKQEWPVENLLKSATDVWELVKEVLSHDSPEGNIPEELTAAQETEYGRATQVVSSYSWRAVKESVSLLEVFLKKSSQHAEEIGTLLMEQLKCVRHRGAFSSVYPAFITCCVSCFSSGKPQEWLNKNLELIQTHSQSITRRSGGLPFLIAATLSAEQKLKKKQLMPHTMNTLFRIAHMPVDSKDSEMDLPQVHAFNCVRTIFTESALSDACTPYVNKCLDLAVSHFGSPFWNIRNCAVMLFTSLQNRLFGTKKIGSEWAPMSSRLFFSKFKGVETLLLSKLQEAVCNIHKKESVETIFPILTILSRLETSNGELDLFKPLLLQTLENQSWKIRETAARAFPCVVQRNRLTEEALSMLGTCCLENQNHLHGKLLAINRLLALSGESAPADNFSLLFENNPSNVTRKTYLSVVSLSKELILRLQAFFTENNTAGKIDGTKQLLMADITTILLKQEVDIVRPAMFSPLYEVQLAVINHCISQEASWHKKHKVSELVWSQVSDPTVWNHVRSSALSLLNLVAVSDSRESASARANTLLQFTDPRFSEDVRSTALEGLAPYVGLSQDEALLSRWEQLVVENTKDDLPFDIRMSALVSIESMINQTFHPHALYLAYLRLSDDDGDIRQKAADILAPVYGWRQKCVPIKVAQHFSPFFAGKFPEVSRAVFFHYLETRTLTRDMLASKLHVNKVLFDVEKQNFYYSPTLFFRWMTLMVDGLSEEEVLKVNEVCLSNLQAMRELSTGEDGPLGFTKDEDVFSLLYGALFVFSRWKSILTQELVDEFNLFRAGRLEKWHPLLAGIE